MSDAARGPIGVQTSLTVAMPRDTNPNGDIFGGWLMSQMDLAGGVSAGRRAQGRTATVAVNAMVFHNPVRVGDLVACYAQVQSVGRTSITVALEAWASTRNTEGQEIKVTEGIFTYVALDGEGRPRAVDPD